MVTQIGIIAGEIIQLLEKTNRPMTLLEVEIFTDHPLRLVDMALGWLIRECYVRIIHLGGEYCIFLTDKKLNKNGNMEAEYLCTT